MIHHCSLTIKAYWLIDLGQVEVFDKQIMNFQHINNYPIFIEKPYNKHDQNLGLFGIFEIFLVWLGRFPNKISF